MKLWLKLALREIRNNFRFSLFFVGNLALGLVGFIVLISFKTSLNDHLQLHSKSTLTADLSISAYRPFSEEEVQVIEGLLGRGSAPQWEKASQITFFSMVASNTGASRLVQIIAVSEDFPLYGKILLEGAKLAKTQDLFQNPVVWIYPELLNNLGVKVGEDLKIGQATFKVQSTIQEDPANTVFSFGFAPRIYMSLENVHKTELVKYGSRLSYQLFYKFSKERNLDVLVEELNQGFHDLGGQTNLRVQTHRGASQRVGRILNYVNDYLGLIALVALFLSGVGTAYLFRGFLQTRFRDMAILMCVGGQWKDVWGILLVQITLLGSIAAVLACGIAFALHPLLPLLLKDLLPQGFIIQMEPSSFWIALLMGAFGSMMFCFPVLQRIRSLKPLMLLGESALSPTLNQKQYKKIFAYLPMWLAFGGLSVWLTQSWRTGSIFMLLFSGSILLLGVLAWAVLIGIGGLAHSKNLWVKIAFRSLNRNKIPAASCFLAIAAGAFLLNLIPQIHQGLQEELSQPGASKLPSFFLIDIQPEQLSELQKHLEQEGTPLSSVSPMIRSRFTHVNGEMMVPKAGSNTLTDRQIKRRRRFVNWGGNLSYREKLSASERIVEGRPFTAKYDPESGDLPEISLGAHLAGDLGLNIGDVLTFDIQGIPIEGKIVNFRRIRWNSFQPNFYIQFQTGVLDDAPKTFIGIIMGVDIAQRKELQNKVVQKFPNVTVVDVSRAVSRILGIVKQMSWALRSMAYLAVFVGLVVVFSITRQEAQQRLQEMNLMKILGARFSYLCLIIQIEFGFLGVGAALFGTLLSLFFSYLLSYFLFDSIWKFSWQTSLSNIALISFISGLTALLAVYRLLREKPLGLLKSV